MKSHLVIVADTGTLKAFYIKERSLVHKGKADLIKRIVYTNAHRKLSDQLSESRGSFRGSGDARSARHGSGEAHHLKSDLQKKSFLALAHDIEGVIMHTPANQYFLALPKPIHKAVTAEIKKNVRSKITKELAEDLTKDTVEDIRQRFSV
ncbi:MAG: host attachment protein [Bacteroidota bacterium]|nr:host attachment protein [Bacteroidota bacterium]